MVRRLLVAATITALASTGLAMTGSGTGVGSAATAAPESGARPDSGPDNLLDAAERPAGPTLGQRREMGVPEQGTYAFLIALEADSTVEAFQANRGRGRAVAAARARDQLDRVEVAQGRVIDSLPRRSPVLYRTSSAIAAVAVTTDVDNVAELEALPGVAAVYPIAPKQLDNTTAVQLQGAPSVWSGVAGNTGEGVSIGVIDTGIDYTHADFGGPGTVAAFEAADATDTQPPAADLYGTGNKVVGGYDFVGDAYNAGSNPVPQPDKNPLDCNSPRTGGGHGTHVAGSAAGLGVTAGGAPYQGSYSASDLDGLRIGPGMAPGADLYALRVFGCDGGTNLVAAAIDWATDPNQDGVLTDRLDVVNLSLGSDFGSPLDGDAVMADAAARAGVVLAMSSGNSGDQYDVGGSPGSATRAIAVASSVDAGPAGAPTLVDTLSSFSSRGIRAAGALKPDVTAVGETVSSAAVGTGAGGITYSGTSMAAPMTAGLAALIRKRNPGWTAEQVKADIVNTAGANLRTSTGVRYAPNRVGSGRIEAVPALANKVLAYVNDGSGAVSVSFGPVEVTGPMTVTKTVRVENTAALGTAPRVYNVGYDEITQVPGVSYVMSPRQVSVPAGGKALVQVALTITEPTQLTKTVDATHGRIGAGGYPLATLADASGNLTLTPTDTTDGAPSLRVPVYSAPRPVAQMSQPAQLAVPVGETSTATFTLSGTGVRQGVGPELISSTGAGLELQAISGQAPTCSRTLTRLCVNGALDQPADLKYVGTATDGPAVPAARRMLYIGITGQAPSSTPAGKLEFDVFIDVDGDRVPDLVAYQTRSGETDAFVVAIVDIRTDRVVDVQDLNNRSGATDLAVFDSDTMLLPISLATLATYGVDPTNPRISYGVASFSAYAAGPVDAVGFDAALQNLSGDLSTDVVTRGLAVTANGSAGPFFDDKPGVQLSVTRNATAYAQDRALGAMIVHFHNRAGAKAQVVTVGAQSTTRLTANPAELVLGSSTTLTVTVAGTGAAGAPTGVVRVVDRADGVVVAEGSVDPDTDTTVLSYTPTAGGTQSLQALYLGNAAYAPSGSTLSRVRTTAPPAVATIPPPPPAPAPVIKVAPGVSVTLSPRRGSAGSKVRVNVVLGRIGATPPTGSVKVRVSGERARLRPLVAGRTGLRLRPNRTVRVQVAYPGDATYAGARSRTLTYRVR